MMSILRRVWQRHAFELFFVFFVAVLFFWVGTAFGVSDEPERGSKPVVYRERRTPVVTNSTTSTTTTTTVTPTTTTVKPVVVAPRVEVAPPGPGDEIYHRLAQCESGDPAYNGPSGYDGAFQFLPSTWNSMGTGYAFAYEAPYDVQLDAAKRLIARSGWGQFPSCAKQLGML